MRGRQRGQIAAATLGMAALLVARPMPATAATVYFAYYGDMCGSNTAAGFQRYDASQNPTNVVFALSEARSLQDPQCGYQQPILPGLMATIPRLEVWYGTYVPCNVGTHQVNQTTYYRETSSGYLSACGAQSDYRVNGSSRITRPDGNRHSTIYEYLW